MSESTLEFGDGSWDQAQALVISTLRQHHEAIEGNGKQGIKADIQDIINAQTEQEGVLKGIYGTVRLIAWFVATGILGGGLWLTSLEVRHTLRQQPITVDQSRQGVQ